MGLDPAVAAVRRAVREALAPGLRGPLRRIERRNSPHSDGATVVVACSGGADSLALAAATVPEAARAGLTVRAVVVDHGLQDGSAAVADAAADALRTVGVSEVAVVPVAASGPGGPEAAARRARYAALDAARPAGAPVLLGHTLDDQAETVLLGLGRGSGARSLAGMPPRDGQWVRPLLGVRRATTRAACAALGIAWWDDPHNDDPRYTRVRLRHEVMPLLEDVLAGRVAPALARTAAQLADDDAALDAVAGARCATLRDVDDTLDAAALAAEPAAVRRRVLRRWLTAAGVTELSDAHLRGVDGLVAAWRGQGAPPLPGGLEVHRRHGRLRVRASGTVQVPAPDPVRSP